MSFGVAYDRALECLYEGHVPLIVPTDEGVVVFEIIPGPQFAAVDQKIREQAHLEMARRAWQKINAGQEFPHAE